ncbi:MAG: DUF3179 domain-containing (seleno)protein, partial [Albidovulum sp.]|uniref:DUF3179 domain-containing (seleno)protein n=1 Tax=Albidovulum sp. TaxID=1872424 RepID=UPI003CAE76B2
MTYARVLLSVIAGLLLAAPLLASPERWRGEWPKTDFSQSSVPFEEILSGGPPKDGIPALDDVEMIPVAAETRLADAEPVMVLEPEEGKARAWPIRYLTWHEIVNDEVAGVPVAVTFCPLCNAGMIFD